MSYNSLFGLSRKKSRVFCFKKISPPLRRFCRRGGGFCLFVMSHNPGKRSCISCSKKINSLCARFCRRCGVFGLFFISHNSGKRSCISCSKKIPPPRPILSALRGHPLFLSYNSTKKNRTGFVIPYGSFYSEIDMTGVRPCRFTRRAEFCRCRVHCPRPA